MTTPTMTRTATLSSAYQFAPCARSASNDIRVSIDYVRIRAYGFAFLSALFAVMSLMGLR